MWEKLAGLTAAAAGLGLTLAPMSVRAAILASLVVWAVTAVLLVEKGRRARIILTEHEITVKGLLRQRRRSRAHAAGVVRATIVVPQASAEVLFILDAHGNALIKVDGDGFEAGGLDRFVDALGLPCSGPDHALSWTRFGRMYPGLVPWDKRHSTLLAILLVSALTLLIVAVITFLSFTGNLPDAP
ncbi:hypothetical protein [Actinomadura madurae]|uniref:hypothetical protein n=1 Tax=Actinomadura madurae TaxID=1993 RepID=UPI0020D2439B|nr:hypothetical protein [Actinomadura madurae]MCP9948767.1 hypothetical protein [Actinomadura madurae]MCP9965543.1 hypothetical protein [Actinomadura madurae]MCP9978025.1 hypothetical protein [Actinomadura madurae]MCQ0010473.1 hypothetical protein [Actinomadura madurae]MCQ0014218.1 hypothetical protein [Actinomadura madurae]